MAEQEKPGPAHTEHEQFVANLVMMANKLAETATTAHLGNLDFTFHSFGELDVLLSGLISKGPIPDSVLVLCYGYVGETLVRQYGCIWGQDKPFDVLPPPGSRLGSPPANAFEMVGARLGKQRVPLLDQVVEWVQAWMPEVERPEKADDVPALMHFNAETFIRSARITGVTWLDYSPESVLRLDDWIEREWPHGARKGTFESMIPAIGAYVGEVLVAHTGAHWIRSAKDGFGVELRGVALPMNRVTRRFEEGPSQSIGGFFSEISGHWLSGEDALPANWSAAAKKRGLFGRGRG